MSTLAKVKTVSPTGKVYYYASHFEKTDTRCANFKFERGVRAKRECLGCEKEFNSKSKFNRLCDSCSK